MRERDDVARAHDIQRAADFRTLAQLGERRHVDADGTEDLVERVIALNRVFDVRGEVFVRGRRGRGRHRLSGDERRQVD